MMLAFLHSSAAELSPAEWLAGAGGRGGRETRAAAERNGARRPPVSWLGTCLETLHARAVLLLLSTSIVYEYATYAGSHCHDMVQAELLSLDQSATAAPCSHSTYSAAAPSSPLLANTTGPGQLVWNYITL